ncbi:MAG: hypothetical protein KDD70_12645 [Bdellovibrionales bacterium]|nr:hypothetical protein [Bdellovibrionales bacterium]
MVGINQDYGDAENARQRVDYLLSREAFDEFNIDFIHPNETHPQHARGLLAALKPGILISVGTERCEVYAGLSDNVTQLEQWDKNPEVVLCNSLNTALLAASTARVDYAEMRFNATPQDWEAIARQSTDLHPFHAQLLSHKGAHEWWVKKVRQEPGFEKFHDAPGIVAWFTDAPFEDANYLHSEEQFQRVHALAKAGRIHSRLIDLANPKHVEEGLALALQDGEKVAAIDVSNAWQYVTNEELDRLVPPVLQAGNESPLLITTARSGGKWYYSGFRLDTLVDDSQQGTVSRHPYFDRTAKVDKSRFFNAIDGIPLG